jgi:hypothetical protein
VDNRAAVDLYLKAIESFDLEAIRDLQHLDMVARYPQSGEVFRGRDNYTAMQEAYPGLPRGQISTVTGESNMVVLPSFMPFGHPRVTVFGGDNFVVEGIVTYPNGDIYNIVMILRLQAGKVIEETWYFAAPFEAPEWRRPFTD